jgi:hypothetical protein
MDKAMFPPKLFYLECKINALRNEAAQNRAEARLGARVLLPSLAVEALALFGTFMLLKGLWFSAGIVVSMISFIFIVRGFASLNRYLTGLELSATVSDRDLLTADLEKGAREAHDTANAKVKSAKCLVSNAIEYGIIPRQQGWVMYETLGNIPEECQRLWSEHSAAVLAQLEEKNTNRDQQSP